jgi:mucin-19
VVNATVTNWNGASTPINDTGNVSASLASLTRAAGESVAGGPYAITAGTLNALSGSSAPNYSASFSVANGPTLTINQAALTATIGNQNKTYGTNDPSLSGITPTLAGVINRTVSTWNGNVAVDDTNKVSASLASLTRTANENVGSYSITGGTLTLSGTSAGNYSSGFSVSGGPTLTINQAVLTATIGNQSKTYGANDPSLSGITPTLAGVVNATVSTWNGNVAVDDTNKVSASLASLTRNPGETVAGGPYAYTSGTLNALTGTSAGNYSASFSLANSPTLTINPATLTYIADTASMTYGTSPPSFSGTVTGFVGGETQASATTGTLAFTSTATSLSNVGSYAINGSGLTANNGNYVFVQAAGNATALTINPAPINPAPINPAPIAVGNLDTLGTAANAAGTLAPSTVMNATVLPSPALLPGSVTFGSNTVLPYGNDEEAAGGSASQQTSNTSDSRRRRRR